MRLVKTAYGRIFVLVVFQLLIFVVKLVCKVFNLYIVPGQQRYMSVCKLILKQLYSSSRACVLLYYLRVASRCQSVSGGRKAWSVPNPISCRYSEIYIQQDIDTLPLVIFGYSSCFSCHLQIGQIPPKQFLHLLPIQNRRFPYP